MVSSGNPSAPHRRVISLPTMVPTTRWTLRMGRKASTFSLRSMAGAQSLRRMVLSSARSRPWSCAIVIARDSNELRGMACVLTLAVVDSGEVVIGHVGDSRLYLIWNGAIRKLTSDHSPVGEEEDAGELTEEQAMLHPRRNEVFRDVGTRPHEAGDDGFIEIRRCH